MSQVATMIRQQLGGGRFEIMTGARDFAASETGLSFRLPRGRCRNKATVVRVALQRRDTYSVEFGRLTRSYA